MSKEVGVSMKIMEEKLALRPKEAAKVLSISEKTLSKWAKEGKIPFKRVNGTIRYSTIALAKWLDASDANDLGSKP